MVRKLFVRFFAVFLLTATAVIAAGSGSPAGAQGAAPGTDLVFLVDGSGSIDSQDWNIQKQGISAAIQDATLFPLDGTIAITVIQWSSSVEVEVERVILDATVIDAVVAEVEAMVQNSGGTSPHLGINAAITELGALADAAANQILCMSTDGTPSSASSLATASSNAEAAGIDRYSVLAIEDLPGFSEAIAGSSYGGAVFGGGSVTTSRNTAEFASLVGGACLGDAVELVALEVNQAIQDWNGSIPLVQDKPTLVRAFVEPQAGQTSAPAFGRLRAFRGGAELGAPLLPVNSTTVTALPDAAARRGDINSSLNFILDPTWLSGDITLELELVPGGGACRETIEPANTCSATVSFQQVELPEIRIVGVDYDDLAGNEVSVPTPALTEQGLRIQSAFPAPRVQLENRRYNNDYEEVEVMRADGSIVVERPDLGIVIADLLTARSADGSDDIYYGVLEGGGGGLGYRPGNASAGYLSGSGDTLAGSTSTSYARNRGVHEVMHNLNQPHSGDGAGNGYCGATVPGDAAAHPFVGPDYADDNNDGDLDDFALLGPLVGATADAEVETEIWGVDVRYVGVDDTLAVVDPATQTAVMSYCDPQAPGQGRWVDGFTYLNLFGAINDRFAPPDSPGLLERIWTLITGLFGFDTQEITFRPVIEVSPGVEPEVMDAGAYTLTMLDAAGAVASTTPFDPYEIEGDDPDNGTSRGLFHVAVDEPGPFSAAIVSLDGVELGRIDASPNAPEVAFVSPADGDSLGTGPVNVEWSATDLDGDDLFSTLLYSPDQGATWRTVAMHVPGTSTTLAPGLLSESLSGTLRLVVTDGLNITVVEINDLVVPNSPPEVTLLRPADGAQFNGVQTVLLEALALDPDEGQLPEAQISWSSDLDGPLGTGSLVSLVASDLSEGTHVVTVAAVDSVGATASEQVSIEITRVPPPPPPPPPAVQSPFVEHVVPGRVEAELFDVGGEGVAYSDVEAANRGDSVVRSDEGVDLFDRELFGASGAIIGSTRDGEYTEYTVTAPAAGTYELVGRVASGFSAPGSMRAEVNGVVVGTIDGDTGGWYAWQERSFGTASFNAGDNVVRLAWDGGGQVNFDWFEIKSLPGPRPPFACEVDAGQLTWSDDGQPLYWVYKATDGPPQWIGRTLGATTFRDPNPVVGATYQVHYRGIDRVDCTIIAEPMVPGDGQSPFVEHVVPGRVEAELFDVGGEGVAYSDVEAANRGDSVVRSDEGVDVFDRELFGASGAIIGSTRDGEYTEYTVTAPAAGTYELVGRVASGFSAPGSMRAEVNGVVVGTIDGDTGGWYAWQERSFGTASFNAGDNVVRLAWDGGGQVNFDWFEIKVQDN